MSISQKDLINFQEEVFSKINGIEQSLKQDNYQILETVEEKIFPFKDRLTEIETRIQKLSSTILNDNSQNLNIDKLFLFKAKTEENFKVYDSDIQRLSSEISTNIYRIDKMIMDNFSCPGLIGQNAKFKNFKGFFDFINNKIDDLLSYKEVNSFEMKRFKEKYDNINVNISSQVNNCQKSFIDYCKSTVDSIEERFNQKMQYINQNIDTMRLENTNYASDLIKSTNDLKLDKEYIANMKEEIYKKFDEEVKIFKSSLNQENDNMKEYKNEFKLIKSRFTELSEFIKDVRFRRNMKELYNKEFKEMSKKINFDKKQKLNKSGDNNEDDFIYVDTAGTGENERTDSICLLNSPNILNRKKVDCSPRNYYHKDNDVEGGKKTSMFNKENNNGNLNSVINLKCFEDQIDVNAICSDIDKKYLPDVIKSKRKKNIANINNTVINEINEENKVSVLENNQEQNKNVENKKVKEDSSKLVINENIILDNKESQDKIENSKSDSKKILSSKPDTTNKKDDEETDEDHLDVVLDSNSNSMQEKEVKQKIEIKDKKVIKINNTQKIFKVPYQLNPINANNASSRNKDVDQNVKHRPSIILDPDNPNRVRNVSKHITIKETNDSSKYTLNKTAINFKSHDQSLSKKNLELTSPKNNNNINVKSLSNGFELAKLIQDCNSALKPNSPIIQTILSKLTQSESQIQLLERNTNKRFSFLVQKLDNLIIRSSNNNSNNLLNKSLYGNSNGSIGNKSPKRYNVKINCITESNNFGHTERNDKSGKSFFSNEENNAVNGNVNCGTNTNSNLTKKGNQSLVKIRNLKVNHDFDFGINYNVSGYNSKNHYAPVSIILKNEPKNKMKKELTEINFNKADYVGEKVKKENCN